MEDGNPTMTIKGFHFFLFPPLLSEEKWKCCVGNEKNRQQFEINKEIVFLKYG